ncbi:hypothetical protein HK103_004991 [Boothiomyces macroporosus]|uniref:HMG box domain-containing protein n=1 Tax=Boothiomyces macroporosus TaxID=261099 RepID=A0AAD5UIT0_9FUNG|nr:hypothetical protein HK103_004991 [Boothiomyces macroporosus]
MTSLILDRKDMKLKIEKEYQTSNSHEVSRICSSLWAKESTKVKEYYRNISIEAHNLHKQLYPEFDWNPHKNVKPAKPAKVTKKKSRKRENSIASNASFEVKPKSDSKAEEMPSSISLDILQFTNLDQYSFNSYNSNPQFTIVPQNNFQSFQPMAPPLPPLQLIIPPATPKTNLPYPISPTFTLPPSPKERLPPIDSGYNYFDSFILDPTVKADM